MIETNPLVSVIIAVYNGEKFLSEAIESVLAQNYRPLELLLVDDGSTDGSAEIAKSFPEVKYFNQTNQGPAAARNKALAVAQGEFIAFNDADDLWTEKKLEIQLKQLKDNPDILFNVGRVKNFIQPGTDKERLNTGILKRKDFLGLITILARKEAFERVGNFNIEFRTASDFEWFTRAKDAGVKMQILEENLLLRRIHDANISIHGTKSVSTNLLKMFKNSIDLQRKRTESNS